MVNTARQSPARDPGMGRGAGWRPKAVGALVAGDLTMLLVATLGATLIRFERLNVRVSLENTWIQLDYVELSLIVSALWLGSLALSRLYDVERLYWGAGEFSRLARSLSVGVVAFILLTYALRTPGLSRAWTLVAWGFAVVLVTVERLAIRAVLSHLRRTGRISQRTLIVGSNAEAADIVRILKANPDTGLRCIGCLASSQSDQLSLDYCGADDVPSLGVARDLVGIVRTYAVDTVVIASSAFDHDVLARMIAELRGLPVEIHVSSGLFEVLTSRISVREVGGVPLITVRGISLSRNKLLTKRTFDLVVSTIVLVVGLPIWLLVVALIKLSGPGPVFYAQRRVGRGGRTFGMLKFRSMVADADARLAEIADGNEASGPLFKMRDDPRITPVGKWLRRSSIDEIPQVLNVLKGEMSLVGPRPPLPEETEKYSEYHWRRMEVVPGMTGLWQVSGRSSLTFEDMVRLDLFYIENWSVALDVSILLRTVPAVLLAQGAY